MSDCVVYYGRLTHSLIPEIFECGCIDVVALGGLAGSDSACECSRMQYPSRVSRPGRLNRCILVESETESETPRTLPENILTLGNVCTY